MLSVLEDWSCAAIGVVDTCYPTTLTVMQRQQLRDWVKTLPTDQIRRKSPYETPGLAYQ
jgi:hypothetical protein